MNQNPYYDKAISFDDFCVFFSITKLELYKENENDIVLYFKNKKLTYLISFLPSARLQAEDSILNTIDQHLPVRKKLFEIEKALSVINTFLKKVDNDIPAFIEKYIKVIPKHCEIDGISSEIQSIIFEFYSLLVDYTTNLSNTLQNLLKIIKDSTEEDLLKTPFSKTIPSRSTFNLPIKFFQWFLIEDGLVTIKKSFIPTIEYEQNIACHYDPVGEVITFFDQNPEDGSFVETKKSFLETLESILDLESKKTKSIIDALVIYFRSEDKTTISQILKRILEDLDYLINIYTSKMDLHRYPCILTTILSLKEYISERYESYVIPSVKPLFPPPIETIKEQPSKPTPPAYIWKPKTEGKELEEIKAIYAKLTNSDNPYIESREGVDAFINIFKDPPPPVKTKIKWIPLHGKYPHKALLLYFFNLIEEKLPKPSMTIKEVTKFVDRNFCDRNGNNFEYWGQSLVPSNENTPHAKALKKAINDALSAF
jgi:hypothetical protein